jgi:hypothetical protein
MTSVPYMQFQPPPRPVAKFPRLPRLEVTHQRTTSFSLVPIAAKSHYMYILDAPRGRRAGSQVIIKNCQPTRAQWH